MYQLQFGLAAHAVQSTGAHAYFPALAKTSLGLAAAALIVGLLVIGASRFVASGPAVTPAGGRSYVNLLALMFTVQMACFGLQETVESVAAGMAVASAPHLLLLGTVGQLPVAALGALALKWMLARFESAITGIRMSLAAHPKQVSPIAIAMPAWAHDRGHLVVRSEAGASLAKRGPPSSLREPHELRGFAVSSRGPLISSS